MTCWRTAAIEEVELGRVVPREARAVVAVVDVALVAARPIDPLEDDRRVAVVPVVVLEDDAHPRVGREVRPFEGVDGVGRLGQRQEPLGMVDDPVRVDAHVVGDHVARQPDAVRPGPVAQVRVGGLATEVEGDVVVVERVRRGDRVRVAAHPLDPLGRLRAFPQADQPQPGDAPAGERRELLVGDRVEGPDLAPVRPRQLVEPDVRALGHQDDLRHPRRIGREGLGLVGGGRAERGRRRRAVAATTTAPASATVAATTEPQVERALLLGQDPDGEIEAADEVLEAVAQELAPPGADVAKLGGKRRRGVPGGHADEIEQRGGAIVERWAGARRRPRGRRWRRGNASPRRARGRRPARAAVRWPGSRWRPGSGASPRVAGSRAPARRPRPGTRRRTGRGGGRHRARGGPRGGPARRPSPRAGPLPRSAG